MLPLCSIHTLPLCSCPSALSYSCRPSALSTHFGLFVLPLRSIRQGCIQLLAGSLHVTPLAGRHLLQADCTWSCSTNREWHRDGTDQASITRTHARAHTHTRIGQLNIESRAVVPYSPPTSPQVSPSPLPPLALPLPEYAPAPPKASRYREKSIGCSV